MPGKHDDALAAAEGRCPRCGAARTAGQEYCVECGLQLPPVSGTMHVLRRGWIGRLGWYPGDWIWLSLLTLLVAIAGAAAAIAFGSSSGPAAAQTTVAPPPPSVPTTTTQPPTVPATTKTTRTSTTIPFTTTARTTTTTTTTAHTTTAAHPPAGRTVWPAGRNGWTNVLFSYPITGGTVAPYTTAARASKDGLPQVGVLDSSQYASLHPGYYVVFSGVYSTAEEAQAALKTVQAAGFTGAYARQITR